MKAEQTLQWMMDFYPTQFPTRKHCLNHLFCVIGNGYRWVNGELADMDDPMRARYKFIGNIERAKGSQEDFWYKMSVAEQVRQRVCPGIESRWEYVFTWNTPSKKHSYLFQYPDDIRPDWLAILEECKELLQADGCLPL